MIAKIASDDGLILPHSANPTGAQRSEASLQPRPRKGCFRALLQLLLMVSEKEDAGGGQANRRDKQ
jgi:hypothetical protein